MQALLQHSSHYHCWVHYHPLTLLQLLLPYSLVYTVASRTARLGALLYFPMCVPYIEEFILCFPYSLVYIHNIFSHSKTWCSAILPLCVPYIKEFILCNPYSLVYTVASRTAMFGALLYYPLCVPYMGEFILCCPYSLVYTVASRTARLGALL